MERRNAVDEGVLAERARLLERAEHDLRERLARRRAELDAGDGPVIDPLHQRLVLVLEGLSEQRAAAERALATRANALGR